MSNNQVEAEVHEIMGSRHDSAEDKYKMLFQPFFMNIILFS